MKQRLADYIVEFLSKEGIKDVFTVVGGGAMFLNDAFGNSEKINCIYNHHEQASAMAAEGYARINNEIAVTCVTTGPGGTNAMTGVLCAYQDGIPMLVISGQVRYNTTVESTGLKLRQFGEQEYTIVESVKPMTKYAYMIKDANEIRYQLEKALYIAREGRKGPVWLDIPLDIQNSIIETDDLESYKLGYENIDENKNVELIIEELKKAKRPVILAGSAIRTSGIRDEFLKLIKKLNIPVVAATALADIVNIENEMYFGNFGVLGGRTGNFIVQNSDLIIGLGCRMSFKQIGFNFEKFAEKARKIVVDIDKEELKKDTMNIDVPICADISNIIRILNKKDIIPFDNDEWINYCKMLKDELTIYQEKFKDSLQVNPYYFINEFNKKLKEDSIVVVGNSTSSSCTLQMGVQKETQRLFANVNCGTMGYDLPASIGACIASGKEVFCITGDGSIQMNIQELQTIVHNNLPIKIIIFNNSGYQAIVNTQNNFFKGRLSGCTQNSGISMPVFSKIANAYGMPYVFIENHKQVEGGINEFLEIEGFAICEVIQDKNQTLEPRVQSKQDKDGTLFSPPIDDLSPFLSDDLYNKYCFDKIDKLKISE